MARIARWKLTAAHHDEDPPGPVAVGPSAAVERPTDAGDPPHVRDGHDDQQPQRYGSDRARRFTEIESRIIARETIRREDVGDFPDDDLRLRLREASTDARRRRQVAESGRLARVRRLRIAQPQSPALGRWLS
jgi:hypothetical protein